MCLIKRELAKCFEPKLFTVMFFSLSHACSYDNITPTSLVVCGIVTIFFNSYLMTGNSYIHFALLTKQQRAAHKNPITARHDSVEIVQAKRCLFECSGTCYLQAKYLMLACYPRFLEQNRYREFDQTLSRSVRVWPSRHYISAAVSAIISYTNTSMLSMLNR